MENKTIRVWNREVDTCSMCQLIHYDDYGYGICKEADLIMDNRQTTEIHTDCPFSKPLTKEDIEGCGFVFEEQVVGIITFKHRNSGLLELYAKYCNAFTIINNGRTVFDGAINNLPEFKLILKMLNLV